MKKGVSKTVVFLILAVIGAIILFTGTKLWAGEIEKSFDVETCRASVVMVSLSKTITGHPWLKLECPKNEIKEIKSNEEFKEKLLTSMKNCWYQYGSGKLDFISNYDSFFGDRNCFVCSVLIPKEEIILTKEVLNSYLKEQFKDLNFNIKEDLVVTYDDPLYVMYGITKKAKLWQYFLAMTPVPGGAIPLLTYKPDARYSMLVYKKSNVNIICGKNLFEK